MGLVDNNKFNNSLSGTQVRKKKGKTYKVLPRGPIYEAILKKKITKKEDIGGNFEIPYSMGGLKHVNTLVDQGLDVNIMHYTTCTKLTNKRPAKTNIRLSLACHSYIYPLGIAEDVLVEVAKHVYPVDFMILDIKENKKRPFILGTPFMTTAKATIKFDKGTITLRSGKNKLRDRNWKVRFEHSGGLLAGIHGLFSGRYCGLVRRVTCGYLWPGLERNHTDFATMKLETKVITKDGTISEFPGKFPGYTPSTEEEVEENEGLKEVWEQMEYVISDSDSDLDQVLDVFKKFHALVERQKGKKLKCIRSDNGGEYIGPFDAYCREHGIQHQKTPPKTPQLNGLAERMNKTLVERVRCLLSHAGLPASFWGEALNTAVHVINLTPCVPLRFDVPDRVWSGKDVSYHHLRVFGCKASVHIPKDERSKLDVKNKPCVFLGYGQDELGYRLYDHPSTRYSANEYVLLTDGGEPECYAEAMEDEHKKEWFDAMQDEM
ncbi:retrovirus-related pol polyprotein from transposon TNT 1-94, partial [Tanacetum coccineum]